MLDTNKRTLHSHPSLLPLRMALTAAESGSPARPQCIDANEQRAMQLIERMKTEYQKPGWKNDAIFKTFSLREMVDTNVR